MKGEMDFEGGGSSKKAIEEMIGRSCVGPSDHTEDPKTSEEPEAELQCAEKDNESTNAEAKKRKRSKPRGSQMQQPADEAEAKKISEKIAAQCRSHFYGVRRKYEHKAGRFTGFFAEMRKPDEVKLDSGKKSENINIKSFKTDVEAAVACSVLIHIFKTCVDGARKAGKARFRPGKNKKRGVVLQCHTVLVQRQLEKMMTEKGDARLPNCTLNSEIRKFCKSCARDFVQIAEGVKNGEREMPEDEGLADAVRRYNSEASQASEMYPPHRIPAEKQSMPSVLKRKFDKLT